jgi:hypothetical protein
VKGKALLLLISLAVTFVGGSLNAAEIKLNLKDERLETECDWAMYLDAQEMQQFLNYPKSTLHPLTRVRISYRAFPRINDEEGSAPPTNSKTFEEVWYAHRTPIGLRRRMQLQIKPESLGMIVLGPAQKKESCQALSHALVRLLVELQFKQAITSTVVVPEENFDQIAEGLSYYHFEPGLRNAEGKQMSIMLSSASSTRQETFFLNH